MDKIFFTDEHTMLVEMIRDFAKNEIIPIAQKLDESEVFPRKLVNQMSELGLMGIPIPKELGGAGMDMVAYAAAVMELAKADASVAITMAAHTSLGTIPILIAGTEEQKKKYVPPLASGQMIGAFGLTEQEAGSDAGATKTTAIKNGSGYTINGGKMFITNAGEAGLINITSRIIEAGENRGIGAFIVPTDTAGLKLSAKEKKMGWRASDTRQLFFEDMYVPAENMLGTPGKGFKTFLKTLTGGRISVAALSVGTAIGAYERALKYATERKAFGKEIHEFQAVSFKLADMATEIKLANLILMESAWKIDQGSLTSQDAAMAKLFCTEMVGRVSDEAIQVCGGMGLMSDIQLERIWRDARIERIWEGTSEIQRHIISRSLLRPLGA